MGVSKWDTPYTLWLKKTSDAPEKEVNFAMRRGIELEPKARAYYEVLNDTEMPPSTHEHKEMGFLKASLDGWDATARIVLEIKCPGKEDHDKALAGQIPEKYIWQLVHQMMVADAVACDYLSFDGDKGIVIRIDRDPEIEKILLEKEVEFWGFVQTKTPPPLVERDIKRITRAEKKAKKLQEEQGSDSFLPT